MPVTNTSNYTTLYSTTAGAVAPQQPYGNANVEAFLNIGTDGGNTVENILANGAITANGNIESNGYFVGDGGYLSNITAYSNIIANVANQVVISNGNVNTNSTFYPVFANSAGQPRTLNIDDGGNTFTYNPFTGVLTANVVDTDLVQNGGGENINLDGTNNIIRLSVTGASNAVVISNSLANFNIPITANGNITTNNTIVANAANLTGTYNIDSAGYYFPDFIPLTTPLNYNANTPGFTMNGTVTTGSNLITGVTLNDFRAVTSFSLSDWGSYLLNERIVYNDSVGGFSDFVFPIGTFISNVDAANSQITVSNNSSVSSFVPMTTGALLSNASANTYLITYQPTFAVATNTDATSNAVTLTDMTQFSVLGATTGFPIQFLGTGFGNITVGTQYYAGNIDIANSQITISTSNTGTPSLQLTTATGNLLAVSSLSDQTVRPLNGGYYFAGPWSTNPPSISNFTEAPSGTIIGNATFTTSNVFVKPVDFNSNVSFPPQLSGQFTRIQNGLLVSDSEYGTATLFGGLDDPFTLAGIGTIHTGVEANTVNARTNFQIVNYTDNGADSASITNPGNPPAFSFTTFTGNVNTNVNDNYLRSGRTIGRIAWYGAMQNNGVRYIQPGSSPVAGVYVQALGDWNNATNANLPMVMAFQYSPLNAAGSTPNYQRINRTFLQAANNTTTIGGATNIEFRPLARGTNATNNRSPSALGNVSINPQKFVDISGYTTGDAVSNGAGALLNVTTTASTWNGNVALRLSRTVGNTANMEFVLPVGVANTIALVDNASSNTIATFTNINANINTGNLRTGTATSNGNILITTAYSSPNITSTTNAILVPNNTVDANGRPLIISGGSIDSLANISGTTVVSGGLTMQGGLIGEGPTVRIDSTTQNLTGGSASFSAGTVWGNVNTGRNVNGGSLTLNAGRSASLSAGNQTSGGAAVSAGIVNFGTVTGNITGGAMNLGGATIATDANATAFSANNITLGSMNQTFSTVSLSRSNGNIGNIRFPLVNYGASLGLGVILGNGASNITLGNVTVNDQVYFRTGGVGGQAGTSQGNINNVAIGNITTQQLRMETGSWIWPGGANVSNVSVTGNLNTGDILLLTGALNNVTSVLGTITRGNIRLNGNTVTIETSTTSNSSASSNNFIFTSNHTANLGNLVLSNNFTTPNVSIFSNGLVSGLEFSTANTNIYANGAINTTGQLNSLRTYASFYNSNDIAITANTVANLDLPSTFTANGVSIASSNQITIARPGTYNIQMSLQLLNTDNASEHEFDVWFAKNGTDIANSATSYTVIKNNGKNVVALNFIDTAVANDYYQIRYAADSANISLETLPSLSTPYVRPAVPSAIVTVVPVGA